MFSEIFVINLDRDSDKLHKVQQEFTKQNLHFTRFPAVDGRKYLQETPDEIKNQEIEYMCQKFCTPSSIGCFLSHRRIWEKIVKDKIPITLICEDDVFFSKHFKDFDLIWQEVPMDWDMVYLGCLGACNPNQNYSVLSWLFSWMGNNPDRGRKITERIFVPDCPSGTHAYALSYEGACKLLDIIKKVTFHVDVTISRRAKNMNIYAIYPDLIYQKISVVQSSTAGNRPVLLNTLLDKLYIDNKGTSLAWMLSENAGQIAGYPISFWTLIIIVALIWAKYYNKYLFMGITGALALEALYWLYQRKWNDLKISLVDLFIALLIFLVIR